MVDDLAPPNIDPKSQSRHSQPIPYLCIEAFTSRNHAAHLCRSVDDYRRLGTIVVLYITICRGENQETRLDG